LLPLQREVGYVLLHTNKQKAVDIYSYRLSWAGTLSAPARQLEWRFVEQALHSLVYTFEHIKYQLITKHQGPVPATYLIEAAQPYPSQETLLPVAKRKLVQVLSAK
jgi:hypothetical protein